MIAAIVTGLIAMGAYWLGAKHGHTHGRLEEARRCTEMLDKLKGGAS